MAGLPGVWAAVKYIHAMGPDELDLIRKHSRCVAGGCWHAANVHLLSFINVVCDCM